MSTVSLPLVRRAGIRQPQVVKMAQARLLVLEDMVSWERRCTCEIVPVV
jgi:hypothetical protein